MPASDNTPAAIHTSMTSLTLPTLQVMTRAFRKTPAPIMFVVLTASAAHAPTPRVSSGRALACELSKAKRCAPISV